jgi:hypothetical protein
VPHVLDLAAGDAGREDGEDAAGDLFRVTPRIAAAELLADAGEELLPVPFL